MDKKKIIILGLIIIILASSVILISSQNNTKDLNNYPAKNSTLEIFQMKRFKTIPGVTKQ